MYQMTYKMKNSYANSAANGTLVKNDKLSKDSQMEILLPKDLMAKPRRPL